MPTVVKTTLILKDKDGKLTELTKDDQVAQSTDVRVECDGPKCETRNGRKTVLEWNLESVREGATLPPDGFFRLISILPDPKDNKAQLAFCSPGCAKDYLTYTYVAPLSPREEAEKQAGNAKVAASKSAHTVVKFPDPQSTSDVEAPNQPCD